ncbi:MAG: hypothetical protein WCS42_08685 [Verrucomicrobiota bacterium]
MTYPIVIGMSGRKQSGKDEVFHALRQTFGWEFGGTHTIKRIAFAEGVKEELAAACGVTLEELEARKAGFRLGLQFWGTEFRRQMTHPDYWVQQAEKKFQQLKDSAKVVVFTDCRFPNECELVAQLGGKMWRVERGERPLELHASETALDGHPFARVLLNNGTLAEHHKAVQHAFADDYILCGKP